jgi:hypothetical protein
MGSGLSRDIGTRVVDMILYPLVAIAQVSCSFSHNPITTLITIPQHHARPNCPANAPSATRHLSRSGHQTRWRRVT